MKIEDLARPGLLALGVAGLALGALAGYAVGVAVSRDPEAVRRSARRVALGAARGVEQATLLVAQAREHLGDLWAEAREEALAEVDAADFERAARAARGAAPEAAMAGATTAPSRARAKPQTASAGRTASKAAPRAAPKAARKTASKKAPTPKADQVSPASPAPASPATAPAGEHST